MRDEAAAVGVADALDEGCEALDVQGVTVQFGGLRVLDDASFSLRPDESLAVACVLETGRVVASGDSDDLADDNRVRRAYLGGHVGG